jgi:hypothetical protein
VPIKERSPLSRSTHTKAHNHLLPKLCADQDLPHPILRRASWVGIVGLWNPISCDTVRESGNKVFGTASARLLTLSRTRTTSSQRRFLPQHQQSLIQQGWQHRQHKWVFFRFHQCYLHSPSWDNDAFSSSSIFLEFVVSQYLLDVMSRLFPLLLAMQKIAYITNKVFWLEYA